MSVTRRDLLKLTTAMASVSATGINPFGSPLIDRQTAANSVPWFRRTTRWMQTNIAELDPTRYDITWWRQQWRRTHTQGIVVNAGGIVAYYPTRVPLHRRAEFLGDRDLFGELLNAARQDGIVVFARMDSNGAGEEMFRAHPEWFTRNAAGVDDDALGVGAVPVLSPPADVISGRVEFRDVRLHPSERATEPRNGRPGGLRLRR